MVHDRIGVRELRQTPAAISKRLSHGETLEVNDRNQPVARIVPITGDAWVDMVAEGRVTLAEDEKDLS